MLRKWFKHQVRHLRGDQLMKQLAQELHLQILDLDEQVRLLRSNVIEIQQRMIDIDLRSEAITELLTERFLDASKDHSTGQRP